jgi:hypothetical protein
MFNSNHLDRELALESIAKLAAHVRVRAIQHTGLGSKKAVLYGLKGTKTRKHDLGKLAGSEVFFFLTPVSPLVRISR